MGNRRFSGVSRGDKMEYIVQRTQGRRGRRGRVHRAAGIFSACRKAVLWFPGLFVLSRDGDLQKLTDIL